MTAVSSFFRTGLPFLALGLALCSCSSSPDEAAQEQPGSKRDAYWIGDQVAGSPKLVIDLSAQRIRYFKGGQLVGVSPISSGRESHSTVTGTFRITEKDRYHRSSLYGSYVDADGNVVVEDVDVRKDPRPPGTTFLGAKMHYFMRVVGAIGMHEGYLPGYPASHGCIRLPTDMAAIFYNATPHGTPVQIVGNASLAAYEAPVPMVQQAPAPQEEVRKPKTRHGRKPKAPKRQALPPGTTLYL
ncbi:L,D-transpeptidase-like protein [Prosthecobacter fusiformis]|uniref:L,D-transpeptidase-like protein n=1 Tax=Prosthecobacter fusiformis TaxID=48464 RepID=A0A4R7RKJ1_9BACT|nr:L,D-transpeptidase family protein [Prosthecobacter fusiformis]TDU64052.1 L,D-transpeptidase-like protein [Prosthecobacter fusiformis]